MSSQAAVRNSPAQLGTRERAGAVPGSGIATRVAVLAQLVAAASPVIVSTAVVVSSATRFTRRGIAMLLRRLAVFNPAHLLRSSLWLVALKGTLLIVAVHRARISVLNRGTVFKARILFCGARRAERLEPLPLVSSLDGSMVLNGIASMKLARPWRRGNFRMPVVKGGPLHAICPRKPLLSHLRANRTEPPAALSRQLFARGAGVDATPAAVIADARTIVIHNHSLVVNIRDVDVGDVVHLAVVVKVSAAPLSTVVAMAGIAKPVVNPSIEPDREPPVAGIPAITAIVKAPIARSPKRADKGRSHPRARHPIVSGVWIPGPIARRPHIVRTWTGRLHVNRQRGRTEVDKDSHTHPRKRRRRSRYHRQHQQHRPDQSRHHRPPARMTGAFRLEVIHFVFSHHAPPAFDPCPAH